MTEPVGERVAKLEAMVGQHDDEINGENGLRAFRHSAGNKIMKLEAQLAIVHWKISLFAGVVVVIGNKLVNYGFDKLVK